MRKIFLSIILIFGLCSIVYGADQWDKTKFADDTLIPDAPGLMRTNNEAIDRILVDYHEGADVIYSSTTEVIVSLGSVAPTNSGGTIRRLRTNTSTTTVGWGNIDTGAEESSTTYYVYAVADSDATTFTIEISKSSSAPNGATYFQKIGSFFNDSGSDIDRLKVYTNAYGHTPTDASGIPRIVAVYDYATSSSSFTAKTSGSIWAYGRVAMSSGTATITNLPFSTTPSCVPVRLNASDISQAIQITAISSTSVTFRDSQSLNNTVPWICVGT